MYTNILLQIYIYIYIYIYFIKQKFDASVLSCWCYSIYAINDSSFELIEALHICTYWLSNICDQSIIEESPQETPFFFFFNKYDRRFSRDVVHYSTKKLPYV